MGSICGCCSSDDKRESMPDLLALKREAESYEPFEMAGTWNVVLTDEDSSSWEGFMCFDPEGGTFLQFNTGWSAKGWEFEIDGNKVTGVIPDQGYWSVKMSGAKGMGKLGVYSFEMTRRAQVRNSAEDYVAGTWDFWNRSDQTLACKVVLYENLKGKLSYENGFEDDTWTYTIKGHMIESDQTIRNAGKLTLTCTPDGTLGIGTINRSSFEAWRAS